MSASSIAWHAAGQPPHEYRAIPASGVCATCAAPLTEGISLDQIETPTFANHADYFRFGSKHVCPACAWLYGIGKGRPGNYLALPARMEFTVISLESVVTDKRPWLVVLRELAGMPGDTPIAGVMTTDVKPRLWPRTRLATVARCGLYVHAPDYDVSEYRQFDLPACLALIDAMLPPLGAGFAKASLYFGLLRDYARAAKQPAQSVAWETLIAPHRGRPHFLPALIAAGVIKGAKHGKPRT